MRVFRKIRYYLRYPHNIFDDIERWVAYRTYDKYHVVKTDLEPGYYDNPELMLQSFFTILKDFVEIECASSSFYQHKDLFPKWYLLEHKLPSVIGRIFFPKFKSRELGLLYIDDHIKAINEDTYVTLPVREEQVSKWEEVKRLYLWWAERDNRTSAWEISGLQVFSKRMKEQYGDTHTFEESVDHPNCKLMRFSGNVDEEKEYHDKIDTSWKEERRLEQEDEDNLISLVKVRLYLWS